MSCAVSSPPPPGGNTEFRRAHTLDRFFFNWQEQAPLRLSPKSEAITADSADFPDYQ
jgi:hypothetical protein